MDLIDHVRQRMDPVQFAKIPAHVTLCYDDEIQDWNYVAGCFEALAPEGIRFNFTVEGARSFAAEGKGIYLGIAEQSGFYTLARSRLLATSSSARKQVRPHITLLHPKHARDGADGWTLVDSMGFPERILIHQISLIELRESAWTVVRVWGIKELDRPRADATIPSQTSGCNLGGAGASKE